MYNGKLTTALFSIIFILIYVFLVSCSYNAMFAVGQQQDVDYPKVFVKSPSNTDCVPGLFHVIGYATDDFKVTRVEIRYLDNSDDMHILKQYTERDFDIVVDLYKENVSSGDFKIWVVALDTMRHETAVEVNLAVDKEPPAFTLFAPADGGTGVVSEPQIGRVSLSGMVSDNRALNPLSHNNFIKIYKTDDEESVLWSVNAFQTPFQFTTIDTMDESVDVGQYTIYMSYEDINGNVGTKQVVFTAAKGDTNTYIQVDSPLPNFVAVDTLTLSGAATNAFVDVEYVQYLITKRTDSMPINQTNAAGKLSIGQAGSFSEIIPLKSMYNMVSGEYNLRVTAYAVDKTCSQTAVVPFEFSSDLAEYDFIDNMTNPVGESPLISAYLNSDLTIDLAATSLSIFDKGDIEYAIMQGNTYLKNWTSITSSKTDIYDSESTHYHRYYAPVNVDALGLADGSFRIMARARLSNDGEWRTISRPLYFDRIQPDVRITSHDENIVTTGINGALTIQGACSDNMGLKSVRIKDDVSNTWTAVSGTPAIWSHIVAVDESESDITVEQKYGVAAGQTKNVTYTVEVSDYAGNITVKSVTVKIEPDADKPVFTFLSPSPTGEDKVSGTFTMSATITDDDFPQRGVSAVMNIYKYNSSYTAADYASKSVPIKSKSWTIEPITGDLNLSDIIDTDADDYEDLTSYIIILTGSGWKNASANPTMARFYVDKTAPVIFIDDHDETNVVKKYCTDSIHFSGYVRYKLNSELIADAPLVLQYTDTVKNTSSSEISLGEPTDMTQNGIHYKKRTFSVTINGDGTSAGFSADAPTVTWSDDEWGNSTKLFTFRATSTTAQQGVKTVRVYLDNHIPTVTILSPEDGYLFDQQGTQSFQLKFLVNDEPTNGNSYSLNFRDNVQIRYKYSGASSWTTASSYGSGDENKSLRGEVSYSVEFANIPDGLGHQLMINVKDFAGNESAPQTLTFHKSTTPPAITKFAINESYKKTNGMYKGTIRIDIAAQDNHGASDDGLSSVYVYLGDTASDNLVSATPKTFSGYKDYDTTSLEDGTYILSAKATDKTGITVTNSSCGLDNIGITVDNTLPSIVSPQLLTMDGNGVTREVSKWTAYIGFRFSVSDNISLVGVSNPIIKIGRTSGGNDILDDTQLLPVMNSQTSYSSEFANFIDMFEVLGDDYNSVSEIFVTVTVSDAAGNEQIQTFTYQKGTMPSVTFTAAENTAFKPNSSNNITITGSKGNADAVWVKLGTGSYKAASISGSNWSCTFSKSEFAAGSGTYTFYAKGIKNSTYETQIIRRKYIVDVQSPTVEITDITAENGEGYVSQSGSTWTAAGKIRISGIYNDDLADSLANISAASLKIKIGSTTKNITNVTRNYNGTAWEWYYIWDTEVTSGSFLSSVVTSSAQTITVSASDIASNSSTDSSNKIQLKPVITGASGEIYPIRQLNSYVLDDHPSVLKYSVAQGSSVTLTGYNLKQGSTDPTVKCGSNSVSLTNSSVHELTFSVGTWTSAAVTVTVDSVASDNVWFSIWKIQSLTSSSHDYDTLDAEGYDACLLSDNKVFVTFARNHKISGVAEYNERDYGAYSYKEGASQAYRFSKSEDVRTNNGVVDPVFYASVVRINDNNFRSMFTYDEFGNSEKYTRYMKINQSGTSGNDAIYHNNEAGEQNTFKNARMVYNGNSHLYIAAFNDDSRNSSPTKRLYYTTASIANGEVQYSKYYNCDGYFDLISTSNANSSTNSSIISNKIIFHVNNSGYKYIYAWIGSGDSTTKYCGDWPGKVMTAESNGWYTYTLSKTFSKVIFNNNSGGQTGDLLITSAGEYWYLNGSWYFENPTNVNSDDNSQVLLYVDDGKGYLRYGNNTSSQGANPIISGGVQDVALSKRGGSNAGVHIAYRDADGNLKYTYIASLSGAAQGVYTIESAADEGVTAAYPKVTVAGKAKSFGGKSFPQYAPNVSYLNNASLNTKAALHFARAAAATPTATTYWEYMVVPSSVPVNSGATYIMSDTNGNPVIVYKGNNRLYAARLQE